MNTRRNVRARLEKCVRIAGTDDRGNPFELGGQTVDFSRRGLGLIVDSDVLVPGMVLSLEMPGKLASRAVVQWTRRESGECAARAGLRLIDPKPSLAFRLAACFLLSFALLTQISFSRPRSFSRAAAGERCTVGLAD